MSERFKALDIWLPEYLRMDSFHPPENSDYHVLVAVCDHFEPLHHADEAKAAVRIGEWEKRWSKLSGKFVDSDGIPPRYSFFYPVEQNRTSLLEALARICQCSGAEVEVHLHHEGESEARLRQILQRGTQELADHGFLSRDVSRGGQPRYGFIHGNWALADSHPMGRHCGVANELDVLEETGCYADFTYPAAPNRCQPRRVNSICRVQGQGRAALDGAVPVSSGNTAEGLLMIQGPLALNWKRRKLGLLPRVENGDLTGANPPTMIRWDLWLRQGIRVQNGPPWIFVKLHTHGGIPRNYNMLLGEPMQSFLAELQSRMAKVPHMKVHFVSAREMANIALAAEAGKTGNPHHFRNFLHASPPVATS